MNRRLSMLWLVIGCTLLVLSLVPVGSYAQETEVPRFRLRPSWNHVTLQGWEQTTRRFMLNRSGSYLGAITDRGIFNQITPNMREEYDLDEFAMQFTPQEDYLWYFSPNGYRMGMTNINRDALNTFAQFRADVEIKKKHHVTIDGVHEDNLRWQRLFLNVGYRYNLIGNHYLGFEHTLSGDKNDLDVNVFYMWGNQQRGMIRLDVTALDYLNNFVVSDINGSSKFVDTLRKYDNIPFLYQLKMMTPQLNNYRFELIYGNMPLHTVSIRSQSAGANQWRQTDFASYLAGLFEYTYDFITAGVILQNRITKMNRDPISFNGPSIEYRSNQRDRRYGAFLLVTGYQARFESWVWYNQYQDQQDGEAMFSVSTFGQPFLFEEARLMIRNRIQYRPNHRGFIVGVEHLLDSRDVGVGLDEMRSYSPSVHDWNSRLAVLLGYQFHPRCIFTLGAGFDLDGDLNRNQQVDRFDNVFGRFEIRW